MAACGFLANLGIFMRRRVPGSLPQVSRDSTKPRKMITKQENNFRRTVENVIPLHIFAE